MLRGGAQPRGRMHMTSPIGLRGEGRGGERRASFPVLRVDISGWMLASLREEDFVVLKMDIEVSSHLLTSC